MKTYNNLFEQYISDDNIIYSLNTARVGDKAKKTKKRIAEMLANQGKWIPKLREIASNYHNHKHTPKEIYDGITRKKRTIIVPTVIELVIQHMQVNILKDILMRGTYEHTYAAIPKRGAHLGKKRIAKWIAKDPKHTKYFLKMDVRHYFDSIDIPTLKGMLADKIKDKRFLQALYVVLDVVPHGLPLGFYTSQWYANWYLQKYDHFVKEVLGVDHYARYMDDMVFGGSNKRRLWKQFYAAKQYLGDSLRLEVKGNYSIIRIGNDKNNFLDFMGFRFYSDRTTLRRSIMLKCSRKANVIRKKVATEPVTVYDARQMMAYKGWLKSTDTYGMYLRFIKGSVPFRTLRKIISRHDRRLKANVEKNRELKQCQAVSDRKDI